MIHAIIMASGKSKRMGTNKLLLPLGDRPLITYTFEVVKQSNFKRRILVSDDTTILNLGKAWGFEVIFNPKAHLGQSESIKLGVSSATDALGYAFVPCDQPLLDVETVNGLISLFYMHPDKLIVPCYRDKWGSPTIFSNRFYPELMALEGDVGGKPILKKHLKEIVFYEVNDAMILKDIDTLEDYELVKKYLKLM